MAADPCHVDAAHTIQTEGLNYILRSYGLIATTNDADDGCPICLDSTHDEPWLMTMCGHKMHRACALKWLQRKRTCPCCRTSIIDKRVVRADEAIERYQIDLSVDVDLLIGMDDDCLQLACAARKRPFITWSDFSAQANVSLRRAYAVFRNSPKALVAFAMLQRVQAIDELRHAIEMYDGVPFKPFGRNLPHEWKTVIRLLKLPACHAFRGPCMIESIRTLAPAHNTRNHELVLNRARSLQALFERRKVLRNDIHLRKSLLERIVTRRIVVTDAAADLTEGEAPGDVVERVMSIQTLERMMRNAPSLMIEGIQIERSDVEVNAEET